MVVEEGGGHAPNPWPQPDVPWSSGGIGGVGALGLDPAMTQSGEGSVPGSPLPNYLGPSHPRGPWVTAFHTVPLTPRQDWGLGVTDRHTQAQGGE